MIGTSERRKLVAAEHPDQRNLAERLANIGRIDSRNAVKRVAARTAIKIHPERGFLRTERFALASQHLPEIFARPLTVAHGKNHRVTLSDLVCHADNTFFGIHADDVPDDVLSVGDAVFLAIGGEPDKDDAHRASDVLGERRSEEHTSELQSPYVI